MFDYDAALKLLLKGSAKVTIRTLSGFSIKRWLDVDLPRVEHRRVDLLGESSDGRLLHIELQSTNDPSMPRRMLEYGVAVLRRHGRYPKQVLLYVGQPPLRMADEFRANDDFIFRYRVVDIRTLNGKQLLDSGGIGDNVLSILTRWRNEPEAVRRIVERIAGLDESGRQARLAQLMTLAGLRQLEPLVKEEASRMPVTEDILKHKLIGPAYKKGRRVGRLEGREEGLQEGLQRGFERGELTVLRRQIAKRFGPIPARAEKRLARYSAKQLEELSERVLDAENLEDLLK